MHPRTSVQERQRPLTKNGRCQAGHEGTGWRRERGRRDLRRRSRMRKWWLWDDALHMREGGRAAAETDGARWPVVGAARNSHALLVGRTEDRRIDTRAVGAGAVAGHTGAGEGAAREPGDIGDDPMIAGKVADDGDQLPLGACTVTWHGPAPMRHFGARPIQAGSGGTNGGLAGGASRAVDDELEVRGGSGRADRPRGRGRRSWSWWWWSSCVVVVVGGGGRGRGHRRRDWSLDRAGRRGGRDRAVVEVAVPVVVVVDGDRGSCWWWSSSGTVPHEAGI